MFSIITAQILMDDLLQLNQSIAEHWLGKLDASQEDSLRYTPVCLGRLPYSAGDIAKTLAASKLAHADKLRVLALNSRYLNYARLAGKDVAAGKLELLISLGIGIDQAHLFGKLTNDEVALLAHVWQGPIMQFPTDSFIRGTAMLPGAAKHHATAYIATNAG